MKKADVSQLFVDLEQSLKKIKTLIAWQQLKREETQPGMPPSFMLDNHAQDDLRDAYWQFSATAAMLHNTLDINNKKTPANRQKTILKKLRQLEQQVRGLNVPARLYACQNFGFEPY